MGRACTCGCSIPRPGQLLREHLRQQRGCHRIEERDRPATHAADHRRSCCARAQTAGTHIGTLCEQIHRDDGEPGVRRILGVLALARKHGAAAVDDAATAALEPGAPNLPLRPPLSRTPPAVPLTLRQVDPLIRQLTLYRDLIDQKTGDPT